MEMCSHFHLLLFLGITLRNIPQIAALEEVYCNSTQYQNAKLNICCDRCRPGYYRKETCTVSKKTLCLPCEEKTFTSKWNNLPACRTCYPCSISLEEKEPCSSTQDTVCGCPEGNTCVMYDGVGVCQLCEPLTSDPAESTPGPSVSTPGPAESTPDKNVWIVLGVAFFIVTMIMVVICIKTSLLKRFGRMIKSKRSSESVPQMETGEGIVSSHLLSGEKNMPLQEEGKALGYPIEETDATQPGEITLLSK